jgi:hypothetical protein
MRTRDPESGKEKIRIRNTVENQSCSSRARTHTHRLVTIESSYALQSYDLYIYGTLQIPGMTYVKKNSVPDPGGRINWSPGTGAGIIIHDNCELRVWILSILDKM